MFSTFPHVCILFLYPHPYFLSPSLLPVATLTFSLATLPLLMLVPGRRWNLLSSLAKALRWDFYLSLISLIGSHCWRVTAGLPSLSWPAAGSQPKAHVHGGPGTVLLRHRIHPQRASLHPQAWPVPTLLRVCVCAHSLHACLTLWPQGLWPARLLCPWNFPDKNTGMGCCDPPPRDLPDPAIEPVSPVSSAVQKVDQGSPSSPLHVASSHDPLCLGWDITSRRPSLGTVWSCASKPWAGVRGLSVII